MERGTFIDEVEGLARKMRMLIADGRPTAMSLLDRQVVFVSEQLERAKALRHAQLAEIYQMKFYTYREWGFIDRYDDRRQKEIKEKLTRIDAEKRGTVMMHEREISRLQERLFTLMNQRVLLE